MGLYIRTIHGAQGDSFQFKEEWYYSPSLPFDVIGAHALRKAYGVKYFDSNPPASPSPYIIFTQHDDLKLELVRGANGLEWLPYSPSPSVRQREECLLIVPYVWSEYEATQLRHACALIIQSDSSPLVVNAAFPIGTSGIGMGKLAHAITPIQVAMLDHCLRGHPSLRRQHQSALHSIGGLSPTKQGFKELAQLGCDVCNAYKIKITEPKSKKRDESADADEQLLHKVYWDQFGKVQVASAYHGYHYAHLFKMPSKNFGMIAGSKDLSEETCKHVCTVIVAKLEARFKQKVKIIRIDSFSSTKGKEMARQFAQALMDPQFSPPGQHAFPWRPRIVVVPDFHQNAYWHAPWSCTQSSMVCWHGLGA
jgi:hypothetical protein